MKQKAPLRPLLNATLVDVLVTSVLPPPPQRLSAAELSNAVVERLRAKDEGIWVGWTVKLDGGQGGGTRLLSERSSCGQVGGKVPPDWEKLLLVLVMTLPGSPAVQYEDVAQIQVSRFSLLGSSGNDGSFPQGVHIRSSHEPNGTGSTLVSNRPRPSHTSAGQVLTCLASVSGPGQAIGSGTRDLPR